MILSVAQEARRRGITQRGLRLEQERDLREQFERGLIGRVVRRGFKRPGLGRGGY